MNGLVVLGLERGHPLVNEGSLIRLQALRMMYDMAHGMASDSDIIVYQAFFLRREELSLREQAVGLSKSDTRQAHAAQ